MPKVAPKINSIQNQSNENDETACVEVEWSFGMLTNEQRYNKNIIGYKITVKFN